MYLPDEVLWLTIVMVFIWIIYSIYVGRDALDDAEDSTEVKEDSTDGAPGYEILYKLQTLLMDVEHREMTQYEKDIQAFYATPESLDPEKAKDFYIHRNEIYRQNTAAETETIIRSFLLSVDEKQKRIYGEKIADMKKEYSHVDVHHFFRAFCYAVNYGAALTEKQCKMEQLFTWDSSFYYKSKQIIEKCKEKKWKPVYEHSKRYEKPLYSALSNLLHVHINDLKLEAKAFYTSPESHKPDASSAFHLQCHERFENYIQSEAPIIIDTYLEMADPRLKDAYEKEIQKDMPNDFRIVSYYFRSFCYALNGTEFLNKEQAKRYDALYNLGGRGPALALIEIMNLCWRPVYFLEGKNKYDERVYYDEERDTVFKIIPHCVDWHDYEWEFSYRDLLQEDAETYRALIRKKGLSSFSTVRRDTMDGYPASEYNLY